MRAPPASLPRYASGRLRLRLVVALVMTGALLLRWTSAQTALGVGLQRGADRVSALGAAALLAVWGLGAAALLARTRSGLLAGAALTDAGVAFLLAALLGAGHPWIPGGDERSLWVPVFAPLGLLALLHAGLAWARSALTREVAVIRGGAALFAAGALAVGAAWVPAAAAAWLGVAPILLDRMPTRRAARRAVEGLSLGAALVAALAPWWRGGDAASGLSQGVYEGAYLWVVGASLLVLLALAGLWRPEPGKTP